MYFLQVALAKLKENVGYKKFLLPTYYRQTPSKPLQIQHYTSSAKGVGWDNCREGSNPSFSAKPENRMKIAVFRLFFVCFALFSPWNYFYLKLTILCNSLRLCPITDATTDTKMRGTSILPRVCFLHYLGIVIMYFRSLCGPASLSLRKSRARWP